MDAHSWGSAGQNRVGLVRGIAHSTALQEAGEHIGAVGDSPPNMVDKPM